MIRFSSKWSQNVPYVQWKHLQKIAISAMSCFLVTGQSLISYIRPWASYRPIIGIIGFDLWCLVTKVTHHRRYDKLFFSCKCFHKRNILRSFFSLISIFDLFRPLTFVIFASQMILIWLQATEGSYKIWLFAWRRHLEPLEWKCRKEQGHGQQ